MYFRAKKVDIDGITFDSKKEANRYIELRELEALGRIKQLQIHPRFELTPTQKSAGGTLRAWHYSADFSYIDENGQPVVEDVKPGYRGGPEYRLFQHSRKMMMYRYGIYVREID